MYLLVNVFGFIHGVTHFLLSDHAVLTSNTTLYCVTENNNTPQVKWSYVDLAGVRNDLTSTTETTTGVSIFKVYTTHPGFYSCEVTENGGSGATYTAVMTDVSDFTGNISILLK